MVPTVGCNAGTGRCGSPCHGQHDRSLHYLPDRGLQVLQRDDLASGSTTLSLTESAAFAGLYQRTVTPAHLDYTLGKSGYIVRVGDPTYNVMETIQVSQPQGLDEALTDHLGTGTAGEAILRILGLRGHNSRVKYTAWNSAGVPSAATVWVYASKAALDADTGSTGAGSVAEYTVTASFDASLRPTVYKSGKVT